MSVQRKVLQQMGADGDDDLIRKGIRLSARSLGIDPIDLATAISYETAGTFDPTIKGPVTQHGQHKGFIQFGKPQARQTGVDWSNPIRSQLGTNGAVVKYLRAAGVRPGMGLRDIYSAINAGRVGRYNASDANNGGAPGTVDDKVRGMDDHQRNAIRFMGGAGSTKANFQRTGRAPVEAVTDPEDGPFPPAPRNLPRTTGPVANSDRDVASRDTRKQNMDPNSLIARMMAAGGRQSTNVEDMRGVRPEPIGEAMGPQIADSPEWQKAVETFMVHYNREPATDADMEMVAQLMKGNDLTNEDVQDRVLQQMGEEEVSPDDEEVERQESESGYVNPVDDPEWQKCRDLWIEQNGREPKTDADFAEIDALMAQKGNYSEEEDPNISGKGGPSDAENPQNLILKLMGVR